MRNFLGISYLGVVMIMPKFLADWIIRRAMRTPYFHLEGYMQRWWIKKPARHDEHQADPSIKTGWGARVHRIMRSDDDRALHDHPFWNISIILRGGYFELTDTGIIWRGVGSVVFRKAKARHRLIVPQGGEAWTLFITGPWERVWGFHPHTGFVESSKYLRIDL